MSESENLFNEDILAPNLKAAAYFILLYEHFEDVVISTVKDVYSCLCIMDGVGYYDIDDDYIRAIEAKIKNGEEDAFVPYSIQLSKAKRGKACYQKEVLDLNNSTGTDEIKDGKKLRGSLNWLLLHGVYSRDQVDRIWEIRKRRNTIVHELFSTMCKGLSGEDLMMIADMLSFNRKVTNWHFQEIDMPVMAIELPEETTPDDVVRSDDLALNAMFRILFCNEGKAFKDALKDAGF